MAPTRRRLSVGSIVALLTVGLPLLGGVAVASEVHPEERASYFRSTNGGGGFENRQLDDVHLGTNIVDVSAHAGTVHGLWSDSTEAPEFDSGFPGPAGVWYRRSADHGNTFAKSIKLDNTTGQSSEPGVTAEGETVHVSWEEDPAEDANDNEEIFYTRSTNGGRNWELPAQNMTNTSNVQEHDSVVAADGNLVALVFEGNDAGGQHDVFVRMSTDGGQTFGPIQNLTSTAPPNTSDAPQDDEPWVDVSGTTVLVAFRRGNGSPAGPTRVTRSTMSGAPGTWSAPAQLPGDTADNTPSVYLDGNVAHVVAGDKDDGALGTPADDDHELVYWRSTDGGASFANPQVLSTRPSIKASIQGVGDALHLAAEEEMEDGGSEIFHYRGNSAGNWDLGKNLSTNFAGSVDPDLAVDPVAPTDVHVGWKEETEFLFALTHGQALPVGDGSQSQSFANEDVIRHTGGVYELVLDGSDVGLRNFRLDALAVVQDPQVASEFPLPADNSRFVLSFSEPGRIPGVGRVDDSDLVLFTPEAVGGNTRGRFSMFFDGSDIGLSEGEEDVDGVEIAGNDLYLSTTDNFSTGPLTGADEDVFVCRGAGTGDSSSSCGTQEIGFDGSAHALTDSSEDIDAFSLVQGSSRGLIVDEGPAFFSARGRYDTGSAVGEESDLFSCAIDDPADFAADCGGSAPLRTTFIGGGTYDLKENLTALALENRQSEEVEP